MITARPPSGEKLDTRYYRSFASYEIPFAPDEKVSYADTEGLRSYYIGFHDANGLLVRFIKVLLVRKDVQDVDLPNREHPGSRVYFVTRPGGDGSFLPDERVAYYQTEESDQFFEGEVYESGVSCRSVLFRKSHDFEDEYEYWPNGSLRERTQTRCDGRETIWRYNEDGNLVEHCEAETASR